MSDLWQKCISNSGTLRGVAISCSELARELATVHQLSGEPAQAFGEALVAGFILASYCKAGERMNLNIKGDGGVKQALVDAYPDGTIRGYVVPNPQSAIQNYDLTGDGPWGKGTLSVLRKRDDQKGAEPYIGTVPLVTGHLAKDLTFYWSQSEQVPSAVGIAVNLDSEGKLATAGGFLVQAMPGATDAEIREIENQVTHMSNLARDIAAGSEPIAILATIFQNMQFVILEKKPLKAQCTCSEARMRRALTLVGASELQAMIDEVGEAVVKCDFCEKEYRASADELRKMIAESKA
ncbi:MAG: Hsp33 family molecular chaperone HslO [Bdellovibrionales bacterium]|nr:Hsp33 family molecular chaperone HslO [Bdellovibrionales bacterium]